MTEAIKLLLLSREFFSLREQLLCRLPTVKGNLYASYNFFLVLALISFLAYSSLQSVVSEAVAESSKVREKTRGKRH